MPVEHLDEALRKAADHARACSRSGQYEHADRAWEEVRRIKERMENSEMYDVKF